MAQQPLELVSKPFRTTSAVWHYFGFVPDGEGRPKDEDKPICKLCSKSVLSKGSNTSNLFAHLRVNHPTIHAQIRKARPTSSSLKEQPRVAEPTIMEMITRAQPYSRTSKKWQRITELVAFCLAKDTMPLFSVEKVGFTRMLHELLSRKYFSK